MIVDVGKEGKGMNKADKIKGDVMFSVLNNAFVETLKELKKRGKITKQEYNVQMKKIRVIGIER